MPLDQRFLTGRASRSSIGHCLNNCRGSFAMRQQVRLLLIPAGMSLALLVPEVVATRGLWRTPAFSPQSLPAHPATSASHVHGTGSTETQSPIPTTSLPVAVDGARTPELISDELALRHFIQAVSITTHDAESDSKRQNALLSLIGLSGEDTEQIILAVHNLDATLDALNTTRTSYPVVTSEHAEPVETIRHQERALIDAAIANVMSRLSTEGRSQLLAFVQGRVKRRIVIYGAQAEILK